ncbi:hypothetical protein GCM10020331_062040 [Ectobacillus funiculus]
MFDAATILLFIGTSIILIVIPGPDLIFFTITQGMTNGRKSWDCHRNGIKFRKYRTHFSSSTRSVAYY